MRLRSSEGSACFLLSDCADADAGSLVRDPRHLQLVGGDSAPLVIDVDSLHPDGAQAASDAAFCTERLVCATRTLDAMLLSRYGIRVCWFSSGKQGVHGFAFGTSLSKPMRDMVAALLPGAESVLEHEAWAARLLGPGLALQLMDGLLRRLLPSDVRRPPSAHLALRHVLARAAGHSDADDGFEQPRGAEAARGVEARP